MEKLQFKLAAFEGPLDLLLHFIKKHKLNIYDVPITELLNQYLDYINEMQANNLEVTSDFLEMAARLVYMKTCSLLPQEEEEIKLRAELEGQLLQLDAVIKAAARLDEMNHFGQAFVRAPMELAQRQAYSHQHDAGELVGAYQLLAQRARRQLPPPASSFDGIVEHRIVSVTSRVVYILRRLYHTGKVSYQEFFQSKERSEMVATFLAMLELVKSKRISFSQNNEYVLFHRE